MSRKLVLLPLLVFIELLSYAQTVDFNYSTANGLYCNPQTVTFTQNCSPTPTSFLWNYGNGKSGSGATTSVTYLGPGTYTVKLTAVYAGNAISTSKTIVINPTPIISLSADRNNLCQPGNVSFTAGGSNFITNYEWNFGDGSPVVTTTGNNINHTYSTYNTFTATLKATTASGCTSTSSYNITVVKFPVSGSVTPAEGCIPSNSLLSVTANLPPGDATQNFLWDFGDGSPTMNTATSSINHAYNITTPITNANVIITSTQGCTNQFNFDPFAFGTPPFGTDARTVSGRSTFCGSETIPFYGKATNANKYKWDFGDGTSAIVTDTLVSHKYRSLGNMRIILTPLFNGCEGVKDTINIVIEGVIADFSLSNTCGNKNSYSFTNLSLGNVDHFEWIFSDNPTIIDSTNYNSSHTFPAIGSFSAYLFLIDSITGCRDSLTRPVITAQPTLTSSKTAVCRDSLINYKVINSYPQGYGYTYEFHINGFVMDLGSSLEVNNYPLQRGDFIDYVVIKDTINGTCNDTLYLPGPTRVRGPIADFNAKATVCFDSTLTINNTSYPFFPGDTITEWVWDYSDYTNDSVQNPPPHVYQTLGIYLLTLKVTDINGCGNKKLQQITVAPVPVIDIFPAIDTLCLGSSSVLIAFSSDSITWSPNTNINCLDCDTVTVNPTTTTQYIATAINNLGCRHSDTSLVKVFAPFNLAVFPADTSICPGQTIQYNTNTGGTTLWSPSTFLNNSRIRNPVARPTAPITYTVTVKDSVGCFTDTAFAVVNIFPSPTVDAGPDQILPYYSSFTISPAYSNDVVEYNWTPSTNLNCNNCPSPTGIALSSQDYKIEVKNNYGCKASDTIRVFINCLNANLLMPNAFTPNQDGRNDYFYPITRGYRIVKYFVIFNRYGQKVFERRNFDPNIATLGWDGRMKDQQYGTTVFTWFMEAECDLGELMNTKGTVVLIR